MDDILTSITALVKEARPLTALVLLVVCVYLAIERRNLQKRYDELLTKYLDLAGRKVNGIDGEHHGGA